MIGIVFAFLFIAGAHERDAARHIPARCAYFEIAHAPTNRAFCDAWFNGTNR